MRWLATDHLGSTSVTADETGVRIAELCYKPWGESRYSFGATPTQRRFTGQVLDNVAGGLYFYNNPSLGRFAQTETIMCLQIPHRLEPGQGIANRLFQGTRGQA